MTIEGNFGDLLTAHRDFFDYSMRLINTLTYLLTYCCVLTYSCAQLTRDLSAMAQFLVRFDMMSKGGGKTAKFHLGPPTRGHVVTQSMT